jgi:PKD repeat protein
MIAIAVAASLVAYAWVSGYMDFTTTKVGKSIQIQSISPTAVYVQNVGDSDITLESLYVNGTLATDAVFDPADLGHAETSTVTTVLSSWDGAKRVTIKVVTTDGISAEMTKTFSGTSGTTNPPANAAPNAAFTSSVTYLDVAFTDASTDSDGTVVAWAWTFGDGGSSTLQSPSHSYATVDTFTVMLTVTDDDGATDSVTHTVTTTEAPNQAPTAEFSSSVTYLDVAFSDLSADTDGTVVAWAWTFGDGATSTLQSPSHSYATVDTFTVTLTVTDDDGATDSVSHTVTTTEVPNSPPTAAFTYLPTDPETGESIAFTDGSTDTDGTIVSWAWTFGDGATSTLASPTHTYTTANTYTVTLTVTDDDGATDDYSTTITVAAGPQTLFSDNFESGSFGTSWSTSSSATSIVTSQSHSPTHSAQLIYSYYGGQSGYATLQISTSGYTSIELSYWRMVDRNDGSYPPYYTDTDNLIVEWRVGTGGSWTNIETVSNDLAWAQNTVTLSGAGDHSVIQIRFKVDQFDANVDFAWIDDVVITGISLP